ncbi:NUDIX hydrolase [Streptosporangiaceae bacterium NEAU-GS5]|nr:NUDIX hydrolase [Streptosporangiaceae bacterium NEAU-GS5]
MTDIETHQVARASGLEIRDVPESWEVVHSSTPWGARVISVRTDGVRMPEDDVVDRDYVVHPGSVGVVALDEEGRVLLLRQYRHAVRRLLWEIPAGLRDVQGEPLLANAERELAEEAGYRADTWHTLLDTYVSPGASNERIRIFLARDLTPISDNGFQRSHEEIDMPIEWVEMTEAIGHAMAGMIHNATAIVGILAAYTASAHGFTGLRPADAPEE